ncbi:hypothetical protein EPA93_30080 [Ktedonosporobacter rubrisoli]|uniref:Glutamate--cysteine ligase n=1 Tax=Ktedonosporobacter rubrisoli TaxID=2509675 RepID=A0A4P6JX78_KTERU|nr:hypothetical protein [Ktedonosporobacter rubrisoli]QBD80003.1 hypothetical protein EPA93_30080 [Ktedonosporobacter rubrisoli]
MPGFTQEIVPTYGGEIEALVVRCDNGKFTPIADAVHAKVQQAIDNLNGLDESSVTLGYDVAAHQVEMHGLVCSQLPQLVSSYCASLEILQRALKQEAGASLLSSAYHPFEDPFAAYQNVLPKPIYDLYRGFIPGKSPSHPLALERVYPTRARQGRCWAEEMGSMAAAIHPWNALYLESAASQVAMLHALGWMFNLLTANSPFSAGKLSALRDYRVQIWGPRGGMMATSRYRQDSALVQNLPTRPRGLADYYRYVFSTQRPMAIPHIRTEDGKDYKSQFLALVQPADWQDFTVLSYLQARSVNAVDMATGEIYEVMPNVGHVINGFDFLYYPVYGARLRLRLPYAELIDPVRFAQAILDNDESSLRSLLLRAGLEEGYLCIEGRTAATHLPTSMRSGWARLSIPFVLQTACLRAHHELWELLDTTGLSWQDLTQTLPALTNSIEHGFQARLKGIEVSALASQIWRLVKQYLTFEERALVGEEIDRILRQKRAAAEEQVSLYERLHSKHQEIVAMRLLVEQLHMCQD